MATILNSEIITYNPLALVNIFNNALTIEATKKAFRIRGIYLPGKGQIITEFITTLLKMNLLMPVLP